jgi:hypothetical protein
LRWFYIYICIHINIYIIYYIYTLCKLYIYMISLICLLAFHLKIIRWEDIDLEPILRLEPPPTAADKAKEDEGARRLDVRFTG